MRKSSAHGSHRVTHLQTLIKAHFACQGLADPVDEGFGFVGIVCAGARHLQLHNFTTVILSTKQIIKTFCISDAQIMLVQKNHSQSPLLHVKLIYII